MDQATTIVLAGALGVAGTAGAAFFTSWTQRRQARTAAVEARSQWRDQARRETYARFLTAASKSRGELSMLWHGCQKPAPMSYYAQLEERLADARQRIYSVQQASEEVAMEGPSEVRALCMQVKDDLAFLFAILRTLIRHLSEGAPALVAADSRRCAEQRNVVRLRIASFARLAGTTLHSAENTFHEHPSKEMSFYESDDMDWLKRHVADKLGIHVDSLDPQCSLMDLGFDSLSIVELSIAAEARYLIPAREVWVWAWELDLSEMATQLTATRLSLKRSARRLDPTSRETA